MAYDKAGIEFDRVQFYIEASEILGDESPEFTVRNPRPEERFETKMPQGVEIAVIEYLDTRPRFALFSLVNKLESESVQK